MNGAVTARALVNNDVAALSIRLDGIGGDVGAGLGTERRVSSLVGGEVAVLA